MHQDMTLVYIGLSALCAAFFFALGYFIRKFLAKRKLKNAEDKAKNMTEAARLEAEKIKHTAELQGKDLLLKLRTEFEKENKDRRQELTGLERRLIQKEESLDRKIDGLDRKEKDIERRDHLIGDKEKNIAAKDKEMDAILQEEKEKLQRISGMTREEAKSMLLKKLEDEV
ncbi:MAG: Rnase Y domain-containing protein, partial [Candidatus Omnitrophota bacterium]